MAVKHHSQDRPNYHTGYNGYLSLFSSGYPKSYYCEKAASSPSLSRLDQALVLKLARDDRSRIVRLRAVTLFFAILVVVYIRAALHFKVGSLPQDYAPAVLGLIFIAFELFALGRWKRVGYEQTVADKLFFAILRLENNGGVWTESRFRWKFAADLEEIAHDLERIPSGVRRVAPEIKRDLLMTAQAKAQSLRQLEMQIIKAGPTAPAEILERLTSDLRTVLEGRWFDLPGDDSEEKSPRWPIVTRITCAIAAIAVAVAFLVFFPKLGSATSVIATVLIVSAIGLFDVSGVPIGSVERYVQAGTHIVSKK